MLSDRHGRGECATGQRQFVTRTPGLTCPQFVIALPSPLSSRAPANRHSNTLTNRHCETNRHRETNLHCETNRHCERPFRTVIASAAWQSRRRSIGPPRRPSHPSPPRRPKIADTQPKRERTPVLYPVHQSDMWTPMGRGSVYWVPPSVLPGAGDGRSTRLNTTSGISG